MKMNVIAFLKALAQRCLGVVALVLIVAVFDPTAAQAKGNLGLGGRAFFGLGPWLSTFKQSDGANHSTEMTSVPSLGIQTQIGLGLGLVFFEYNLSWLTPQHFYRDSQADSRDAVYWSLFGLNAGLALPFLPVEVSAGYELGNYRLSSGTNTRFGGSTVKGGVTVFLGGQGHGHSGLRVEYKKFYGASDDSGRLPADVNVDASIIYIGLIVGIR